MSDNSEKKLFAGFPPVSVQAWEEVIRKDLKGADYEKKLIWQSLEGIPVRPYYSSADIKGLGHLKTLPGEFPFVRGKKTGSNGWLVRQDIYVDDIASANTKALDALMKGATSIGFVLDDKTEYTRQDINLLLRDICLASAEINFISVNPPADLVKMIDQENISRGGAISDVHGSVEYDPLGTLLTTGKYPGGEKSSFGIAVTMAEDGGRLPNLTVINVNSSLFHNAGGSAVEELAFAISSAAEYMERLTAKGISPAVAAGKIKFTFSTGSNYFMETGKFRAARYLWAKMLEAWQVSPDVAGKMVIHAVTSRWNKTIYDPYVNMLRSTTEAMSAILGGTDSLTVERFDKIFKKEGTLFSERIARNTQLVLKEEAYLDKVIDPAAGSYYIESLTDSLIGESWKLFLEVNEAGGLTEAFKKGTLQERIEATAKRRDHYLANRRDTLLGTNKYPDSSERVLGRIDASAVWPARAADKDRLARPLKPYRGAQAFEELRIKTEKYRGETPKVFLLTYGNLAMRKARAEFSAGFFGCAGFDIIYNQEFSSPADGAKAALESSASVVVVCSSDDEYPLIVPEIAGTLGEKSILAVAGYPKESIEELKNSGVKHFIHVRSDVPETLQQFQKELGIE
ncbi:MAG: methylmalonyl-CoA mutase family protein [Bacteroidales bacterium]